MWWAVSMEAWGTKSTKETNSRVLALQTDIHKNPRQSSIHQKKRTLNKAGQYGQKYPIYTHNMYQYTPFSEGLNTVSNFFLKVQFILIQKVYLNRRIMEGEKTPTTGGER